MSFGAEPYLSPDLHRPHCGQVPWSYLRSSSLSSQSSISSDTDTSASFGPRSADVFDNSPPTVSELYRNSRNLNTESGFGISQESTAGSSGHPSPSSSLDYPAVIYKIPFPSELACSTFRSGGQPRSCLPEKIQGPSLKPSHQRPSGYGYSSQPVQPSPKPYLMETMADNSTHNYGWHSRSSHPLHPSTMAMEHQPFSQPQTLPPSTTYPVGYGAQQTTSQSFYQPGIPAPQYLCSPHPSLLQGRQPPRGSAMPYSFPSSHVPGSPPTIADQQFTSSPPSYLLNHSDYYYSHGSSLPSNPSSLAISPPSQHIMTPGTVYSSPDSAPTSSDPEQQVRVISFRPKPQCWDHGCNGREFSTFSNLLRHQREKSGVVAKAECPSCGAVFTRTTARNIHVSQGKCKGGGRDASSE